MILPRTEVPGGLALMRAIAKAACGRDGTRGSAVDIVVDVPLCRQVVREGQKIVRDAEVPSWRLHTSKERQIVSEATTRGTHAGEAMLMTRQRMRGSCWFEMLPGRWGRGEVWGKSGPSQHCTGPHYTQITQARGKKVAHNVQHEGYVTS